VTNHIAPNRISCSICPISIFEHTISAVILPTLKPMTMTKSYPTKDHRSYPIVISRNPHNTVLKIQLQIAEVSITHHNSRRCHLVQTITSIIIYGPPITKHTDVTIPYWNTHTAKRTFFISWIPDRRRTLSVGHHNNIYPIVVDNSFPKSGLKF
jgi:hypothetical protein